MYYVRHGNSALYPMYSFLWCIYTYMIKIFSIRKVRSWYPEIQPVFSETTGLQLCRISGSPEHHCCFRKDLFLFIFYHQCCKLCYEFLLCSKNLYWNARVYQEEIIHVPGLPTQKRFNKYRSTPWYLCQCRNPICLLIFTRKWIQRKWRH